MNLVEIGKISSSHGLKGAFKIERYIDDIDDFFQFKEIYVFGYSEPFEVTDVYTKKQSVYLKLKGIDDIGTIERLIGDSIYVDEADFSELKDGEFFHRDLIGLDVYEDKKCIGRVSNVINGASQDIVVISHNDDEAMIPFVKEFFSNVDIENNKIEINSIEGLIPWL